MVLHAYWKGEGKIVHAKLSIIPQRHMREWRYSPTHPAPWHRMEVSGSLYDEATIAQ